MHARRARLAVEQKEAEHAGRKKAMRKAERRGEILDTQLKEAQKVLAHLVEKRPED